MRAGEVTLASCTGGEQQESNTGVEHGSRARSPHAAPHMHAAREYLAACGAMALPAPAPAAGPAAAPSPRTEAPACGGGRESLSSEAAAALLWLILWAIDPVAEQ